MQQINSLNFRSNYFGHSVQDLKKTLVNLRALGKKRFVYLAGDSSLDSKHWFSNVAEACNGYEHFLTPPITSQDISYYINHLFVGTDDEAACINAAVEEATVCEKIGESGVLNAQDKFIRNNITENDTLVVSIGGNDIALKPSFATIYNIGKMMMLNNSQALEEDFENCWGAPHFIEMFHDCVQLYIQKLIGNVRPKKVIVCCIYYPNMVREGWASGTLDKLDYYNNPQFLQTVIRQIYKHATQKITLDNGIQVETFAMFEHLNGSNPQLYCQGVEPSALGNKVLAQSLYPQLIN